MKKSVKRILAIAVILALALCLLSGCSDDTQAKIDEAVKTATETLTKEKDEALAAAQTAADEALKSAQEAADTVKGELEAKVADLEKQITDAADAAVKEKDEALAAAKTAADETLKTAQEAAAKEKDEALAAAKTAADEALKSAQEAADAVKADLEGQVTDLTEKLSAADAVKTELEGKVADLTKQVEDIKAAATEGADAAAKAATEAADAAKKELEAKVDDLTKKLADTEAVKGELETKVADLEKQIADAAEAAKKAAEEAAATVEEKAEVVAEAVAETVAEEPAAEEPAAEEPAAEEAAVMSHADYIAAELDTEVTVETYVQATQSWWDGKITIYAQSEDGAYFIYNAACSEEDAAKLVAGAKIKVKGFKSEWSGEVEITDATIEFVEGDPFIAEAADITDLLGQDGLIEHQNEKVLFKGLTVVAQDDGAAFNYKNAENKTDDLYVRFTKDDVTCDFCVEFYLCGNDTEVYKAVEALQVGDVVDVEGFLYWYNGANVHMTAVTKAE